MRHERCSGTYYNGPDKAYGICNRCRHTDYDKYEGDRCERWVPAPPRRHIGKAVPLMRVR